MRIAVQAIKLGAEDCLVKPNLTPEHLNFVVQNAIQKTRLQLELQVSQEQLRIGIQVAGVALARFDYTTGCVFLSSEAAVMYGISTQLEVTRECVHGTFHPDECLELLEIIDQVLNPAGKGWFARDHRVVWPSGEVRWLSVHKQVFFDRSGEVPRPNYGILTAIDITERKRIEAALQESEDRFRTLADNISQLAWMADTSGSIFWFNRRWFQYTGTTLPQMQGWGWQQVHHPDHSTPVVERFRYCIETGERWEDTFPLRRYDGTYRWFLSRAIPIADAEGKIIRWFGTNTDVTDLKQAQAALEERNQELDNFVYVVSHDLKAPLRSVSNLSQWIEEDMQSVSWEDTQQQMALLRTRVQRMSKMIDGLLDYARIGQKESRIEQVAVAELLNEVIDAIAPPPTFTISVTSELPIFLTKRLPLFQVFTNLIDNAVKHHNRGDGLIQISSCDQGDFYEFAVADDGVGISPEYQGKIFMIFQTGKPQEKKDSTGIGLAIVKKIVENEKGRIRFDSEIGKGTTFYFTWPKQ